MTHHQIADFDDFSVIVFPYQILAFSSENFALFRRKDGAIPCVES
jgi:hypothetical protein